MRRRLIEVKIALLASKDGGRVSALSSGYRSLLRFEGCDVDFGFELEFAPDQHRDGLNPGESGLARLSIWAVDELPALVAGQQFEIREGLRVVGYGSVLQA